MTPLNTNVAATAVRELLKTDLDGALTTLAEAFQHDPILRYVVPDSEDWQRVATGYFRLILHKALRDGCATVEQERRGISIWEPPGHTTPFIEQSVGLLRMALLLRSNLGRAFRVQSFTEPYRPRRPHWYLAYVGTAPAAQGRGIGRSVLTPMLDLAEREQAAAYLECSRRENIAFYASLGFTLVDEIRIPDGPTVWPMIREPGRS